MSKIITKKTPALIPSAKVFYIDHVKVLLTILVIFHHAFITYGAPGGWYYKQPATSQSEIIPMTLFVAINQSFFMGLFFFLSSYFIEPSYERKGASVFIMDRLKRLGIPLLFYSFILSPVMTFLVYRYGENHPITFVQYLGGFDDWIDFGVLWFVAALLLFTLVFVLYKKAFHKKERIGKLPSAAAIFLFSFLLGIISFLVRILFPVGWTLHPVGFQFAYFSQYIAMFCIGIIAKRNGWLAQLNASYVKRFGIIAIVMIGIVFPMMFFLKETFNSPMDHFMGGLHWESLLNSLWEQITGISIMVFLLSVARLKWNYQSLWLSKLSRSAFGVYIFHPLFLIVFALLLSAWDADAVVKLIIVAPAAIISSFLFSSLLVKIKGVSDVI